MKDKVMFLLPILVLVFLGVFYSYRWWSAKNRLRAPEISDQGNVEISEQGNSLLQKFGVPKQNSIQMQSVDDSEGLGVVNWSDDKKSLTIIGTLPELRSGYYQAWLENADGNIIKLGTLKVEKAGFLLDYVSRVPLTGELTIIVSKETKNDNFLEKTLLEGALSL